MRGLLRSTTGGAGGGGALLEQAASTIVPPSRIASFLIFALSLFGFVPNRERPWSVPVPTAARRALCATRGHSPLRTAAAAQRRPSPWPRPSRRPWQG